jgi:hypothetical protein
MARMQFDAAALHKMWYSKMTNAELCFALNVSRGSLDVLRRRYRLDRRPFERNNREYAVDRSPSPEEIEERAAAVRATWSDEEAERRYVGKRKIGWAIPAYAFARRDVSFIEIGMD